MRAVEAQAIREAKEASLALAPAFDQFPHEMLIRKGDVWKEISRVLDEKHVDLIVLGTHGRTGVSKLVLGSVAENIFRHAPRPVLTIGPHIHGEPDRFSHLHSILVPTDFSEESAAAISCAVPFALANQSRLYLLHVAPSAEMPEHSLKHVLRNLIPADADFAFAPKVFLDTGVPSQKILDLADELAVDLIVLGVKPPALFREAPRSTRPWPPRARWSAARLPGHDGSRAGINPAPRPRRQRGARPTASPRRFVSRLAPSF